MSRYSTVYANVKPAAKPVVRARAVWAARLIGVGWRPSRMVGW